MTKRKMERRAVRFEGNICPHPSHPSLPPSLPTRRVVVTADKLVHVVPLVLGRGVPVEILGHGLEAPRLRKEAREGGREGWDG